MQQGDFTQLAKHYHNRVGYSIPLLKTILHQLTKTPKSIHVADVGAGTGKLTECLVQIGLNVVAVEPNDAMRAEGKKYTAQMGVEWSKGSGEATGLPDKAFDWALMGSAFHWVNLEEGLKEFHRILKPGGMFTILWNPRDLERSELQKKIDDKIRELVPNLKRVSSGGKGYADNWFDKLSSTGHFKDVVFLEAKEDVMMTKDQYMGLWHSVNDIQAQAGEHTWKVILKFIESQIAGMKEIKSPYATRAWTCWRVG
jgi:ubiquinone/menaquinone biosynthesis C-methylase UbiE